MTGENPIDVVVVGQTPPPFHGQAIMIQKMLDARFERVRLHPVRMAFSREIREIGRFQLRKVAHMAEVVAKIAKVRLKTGARVLYYPPSGFERAAVYRDIALLMTVRPWFQSTVFHFHAGGMEEALAKLSPIGRRLFHRAFDRPTCAIRLSGSNPPDGETVSAKKEFVIPHGIEDAAAGFLPRHPEQNPVPVILSVGILRESKGVLNTLDACSALHARGVRFALRFMGDFIDEAFEKTVRSFVNDRGLSQHVDFLGVLTGEEKRQAFLNADLLSFPTFYENETFGLVALEAMQFSLPVVASTWRALPSIVEHRKTGLLVPPRDPKALAEALEELLLKPALRMEMGRYGRDRYLAEYTMDRWISRLEQVFLEAGR